VTVLGSGDRLEDRWRELMVDRRLVVTRGAR
jgi:hypothetical protein